MFDKEFKNLTHILNSIIKALLKLNQNTELKHITTLIKNINIKLMTFVSTNKDLYITFVPTNIDLVNMTIEEIIQSSQAISSSKKTILHIHYTNNVLNEKFNEILKPFELSIEQFNVLRILRGQKGKPANMCVIQERMIAKTSNTTRLVDKLLLKEYVTRAVCPDNRRKIEVLITSKGLELLEKIDPKIIAFDNSFTQNLTEEEFVKMNELLEKFRKINL